MVDKVNIRGIEILAVPTQTALVEYLFSKNEIRTGRLVAINAEKIVLSEEDRQLRQLIQASEYNYADGISIVKSIHKKYPQYRHIERIAGADLWLALIRKSAEMAVPVFLIGSEAVTLAETSARLSAIGVNIVGQQDGYFSSDQENELIERVQRSGAKLITVALGSPKQELLIQKMQSEYPNALYMGVGGSYDVFIGKVKRAPLIWQKMGLEWLYRLLHQPTRWKRQIRLFKYAYYYVVNKL
ncbi:lipopolysaccharide N-acetylmannosaminouronosyltransferase [Ursidibacter sp. B-7004-1]